MSRKKRKSQRSVLPVFIAFILIAFSIVLLLEYLEFRQGNRSLVFDRLLGTGKPDNRAADFTRLMETFLQAEKVDYTLVKDDGDQYHFKLKISSERVQGIRKKMAQVARKARVDWELIETQKVGDRRIFLYLAGVDNQGTHAILINVLPTAKQREKQTEQKKTPHPKIPRIALVIDDVGNRQGVSLDLKQLGVPITAAVIPHTPFAAEEAEKLRRYGLEVIVHLPMEPERPSRNSSLLEAVHVGMPKSEIQAIVRDGIRAVPGAVGMNNHEGSRLTAEPEAIRWVLEIVKDSGLFFLDSRTSSQSVAYSVARDLGLTAFQRDVFLDSDPEYEAVRNQIRLLVRIARKNGRAVAIGHPFATTLQALKDSLSELRASGIKLVFLSTLMK